MTNGTRRGRGVSVTPRPLFTPGKDPVPTVQEAGWAPGPVWTGAENFAPIGIRFPDRPARSQSLYRLSYRPHLIHHDEGKLAVTPSNGLINPLNPELNPICYLLALLGAHRFLHVSGIRVKSLTLRLLMSYIYIYLWGTYS